MNEGDEEKTLSNCIELDLPCIIRDLLVEIPFKKPTVTEEWTF